MRTHSLEHLNKWAEMLSIPQQLQHEEVDAFRRRLVSAAIRTRECHREEYTERAGAYLTDKAPRFLIREWTFHYSDGTEETITKREPRL